jgi:hypothetical protein
MRGRSTDVEKNFPSVREPSRLRRGSFFGDYAMLFPIAFHITWGTYGTRLHGAAKPHVDRITTISARRSRRRIRAERESRERMTRNREAHA